MNTKETPAYLSRTEIKKRISVLENWLIENPDHFQYKVVEKEFFDYIDALDRINDSGELMAPDVKTDCYNLINNKEL